MSNLSRTPTADRRSAEQDRNAEIGDAEIGDICDAFTDVTRQLVLDSEEITATDAFLWFSTASAAGHDDSIDQHTRIFPRTSIRNDR